MSATSSRSVPAAPPSQPLAAAVLQAQDLACRRGRRLLFKGLNLQLPAGSITWLRGRNGSGKTSLLRILAGLSSPAHGTVLLGGQPLAGGSAAANAAAGALLYIGHANALKDDLTLAEALAFLARLQGLGDAPARARAALHTLGLASRQYAPVRTLSQGQRRRGALARLALDDAPRSWILDEPFDALDQDSVTLLAGLVSAHAARGGAVLMTSHQAVHLPGAVEFDLEPYRAA